MTVHALDDYRRRAEDVPGVNVRCAYSGQDVEGFVIWNAHHLLDGCCCISEVVERINVLLPLPREELGVFLLDVCTIGKHDCREIARGRRTVDGPAVATTRQNRQSPCMIDVRMRQDDGIDVLDWQRKAQILLATLSTMSLEHSAVQKYRLPIGTQDMTGPSDFTSSTRELDFHTGLAHRSRNVWRRRARYLLLTGRSMPTTAVLAAALMLLGLREAAGQRRREVVVTFDDLPAVAYVVRTDDARERITDALVSAVGRHRVPAIGFVNEGALVSNGSINSRRVALLRRWVDAGLELGNHTYSHRGLHQSPLGVYLEDIARGDSVTTVLLQSVGRRPRYFRHPFLHLGRDLETRQTVERFLADRGYQVAPVTIDNSDYIFASAYERAVERADTIGQHRIATAYVSYMEAVFAYYEQQSMALLGRELPQVLLLHANLLNADHFDALAGMIARRGYTFVSLDRALADPAYRSKDSYTGPSGISWLHRWALTQGKRGAFFAGEPMVPDEIVKAASAGTSSSSR